MENEEINKKIEELKEQIKEIDQKLKDLSEKIDSGIIKLSHQIFMIG